VEITVRFMELEHVIEGEAAADIAMHDKEIFSVMIGTYLTGCQSTILP